MAEHDQRAQFEHPLAGRYASKEMSFIWSPMKKFTTWRKLWIALAQAEKDLGLNISQSQIDSMQEHVADIDFEMALQKEREVRHDVMAHVHTFGQCCPEAKPIIHLGATSCFVGDNTDLIQMKEGMLLLRSKLLVLISKMKDFALTHASTPTLGYTHCQPAQLTTIGKRCVMWLQDFVMDIGELSRLIDTLPLRGVKGTVGTQATFLELFEGDHDLVLELDRRVCQAMGFKKSIDVTGQTYSRKLDFFVLSALSGLAQSAYKMCGDIRLLASMKEIEEPFEKSQIGSSAMAYKRNPMRSERVCSLSRYLMSLPENAAHTHANQWFERTLDDSANRRLVLPEAFLTADVIVSTMINIIDGLHVWPAVVRSRIQLELPFMATEAILMQCVIAGGDRQVLHEAIRVHSMEAGRQVKEFGRANDLLARIKADPLFAAVHEKLDDLVNPILFIGRAPQQVEGFVRENVDPLLAEHQSCLDIAVDSVVV